MVRLITRLALVVLAVLVATGPSALPLADLGAAAGVEPLDEPDEENVTDGNLIDDGLTDENLTDDSDDGETTDENLTDETLTNESLTNTSDDLTATTAVVNETAETVVNETGDATDPTNATTEILDSNDTAELDGAVADSVNATENAANVTDEVDTTSVTDEAGDAVDAVETIDATTDDATAVNASRVLFESVASPLLSADAADVGDVSLEGGTADDAGSDDGPASGAPGDSDPATERDDGTENRTTAAGTDEAGRTAVGASDAESAASGTDSDRSPDPYSGAPPSGTEAVAGVGALTAAALFPHLADGLRLAGDAGALSAASSTPASSRPSALRSGFDRLWRTATAFRYSRYDDSDPLAHETRARLHETVERSPGAYLSQICERADVAVSTARHHLDVLDDEGLVATAKVRGRRRYFPAHSDDVELAAALEDEETADVLRTLARLGDSHGGRLADELDRDPSTVSHHLSRLEDAGLVEREREGRAVVNRLAPEVERVLDGEEIEGDGEADAEAPAAAD